MPPAAAGTRHATRRLYWMRLDIVPEGGADRTIPLKKGYIQVEMPQDLIRSGRRHFAIRWTGFFR